MWTCASEIVGMQSLIGRALAKKNTFTGDKKGRARESEKGCSSLLFVEWHGKQNRGGVYVRDRGINK